MGFSQHPLAGTDQTQYGVANDAALVNEW